MESKNPNATWFCSAVVDLGASLPVQDASPPDYPMPVLGASLKEVNSAKIDYPTTPVASAGITQPSAGAPTAKNSGAAEIQAIDSKRDVIKENYAELVGKVAERVGIKVRDFGPMALGLDNINIWVIAEDGSKYFLKLSPNNSIDREIFWFKEAAVQGVSVPTVLASDRTGNEIGVPYGIQRFIEGTPVSHIDATRHYKVGFMIGQQLRMLHQQVVEGYGDITQERSWTSPSWADTIDSLISRWIDREGSNAVFTQDEIQRILSSTVQDKRMVVTEARLLHGDPIGANVLYSDKTDTIVLLDPGGTGILAGDPMYDLARAYTNAKVNNGDTRMANGIFDGYSAGGALSEEEMYRFDRLRLLISATTAMVRANRGRDSSTCAAEARQLLSSISLGTPSGVV